MYRRRRRQASIPAPRVVALTCGFLVIGRSRGKVRKEAYTGFLPAVAPGKLTDMSRKAASWRLHRRTTQTAVNPIGERMDRHLRRWARRKYKRLERSDKRARAWLCGVRKRSPGLFAHWALRDTT
jgi:RNA-directed DNA polymerase